MKTKHLQSNLSAKPLYLVTDCLIDCNPLSLTYLIWQHLKIVYHETYQSVNKIHMYNLKNNNITMTGVHTTRLRNRILPVP